MKISDIIKKSTISSNLNIKSNLIFPLDINIDQIDINEIEGEFIYFEDNKKIIGNISKNLIAYLQNKKIHNFFPDIMDKIKEGIIAIDENGKIFYANKNYSKILGIPLYHIIGKYIQDIEKEASIIKVLSTHKEIFKKNNYIKSLNKYVDVKILPLFIKNEFKGAISIFNDITEITNLNKEVIRISSVAEEYNQKLELIKELKNSKIVGEDPKYLELITKALIVSKTDVTVLILGENGVGKDVLSNFIHNNSKRASKPFITLNCATIPESLIESELFGYEGGSFTGAKQKGKIGKFQLADQGTIFLDEIGDMSFAMQAKLLRTLETGEIEKIGNESNIKVDVRVIAATNQNLEKKIEEGSFREDLYYRLSIITLEIPPLRERNHDIILLINSYLNYYNKKYNKNLNISTKAYSALLEYNWPGNIRELKNCIEHAVILTNGDCIYLENLPKKFQNKALEDKFVTLEELLNKKEKEILLNSLISNNWNKEKVAKILGIGQRTLYRKIKKYEIKLP
ncbi:sigma 54-interacting transcriptional regulator [Fusobacterium simiae]|uniref:Sigma 54-interacting transcriptional regulator n=1 Tax=Fusobacterium simiae TaxID=855 RepID=A0ABT4DJX5_FUSSI|nr:sigma 54-interacting transcriptional regulator [Fusobacterium simiae]MCY7008893.1 sigma 54-interacting transcriptional regulator [Fusobacterium simiae]